MTGGGGVLLLAGEGGGLVERWQDMGPTLWIVAGGLALAWLGSVGLVGAWLDPRRVRPGAATLEVQGAESPAVVNLLTTDWDLRHEAIPATLIDLAARRHLEIDLVGGRTFVTVRRNRTPRPGEDGLTRYEEMVLGHVRHLAGQTGDGRVPAEALTTGPDETAKHWWKQFRSAVVDDARARGLSRPRWSTGLKVALSVAAVPVAVALALAMSTMPDDPDDPDDNPAGAGVWVGIVAFGAMSGLAGSRSGERDTPEGRVAAARWLGLRELLEEDPLFAEQPPAAVAIWGHLLAQGTALGVAHGVVQALPLGAESEREAWSSVGGRWRVVRISYPRRKPPGYGRHPALVTLLGALQAGVGYFVLDRARSAGTALREALDTSMVGGVDLQSELGTELPAGTETGIDIGVTVVLVVAGLVALRGTYMALVGLADLVTGRTQVEGRVLRRRERVKSKGDNGAKTYVVHIAVDDGTEDRIRAWRFRSLVPGHPGQTMRGRVSRRLRHVADLERVMAGPPVAPAGAVAAGAGTTGGAPLAAATTAAGRPPAPAGPTPGTALPGVSLPGGMPAPVATIVSAVVATGIPAGGDGGRGDRAAGRTPPPPLPDDATVSAAAGRPLVRDSGAAPHPAALPGGSAIYRVGDDGHVQVVWVPEATIDVYRRLPEGQRHMLPDLGDEAYRARFGGGVMARAGRAVVMVTPHLPDLPEDQRDDVAVRVASAALAGMPAGAPRPAPGPPVDR
jgi:hypothetical protein